MSGSTGGEDRGPSGGVDVPPVGLNWAGLAHALGVPESGLRHDGQIVLAGEYFPGSGYFFHPHVPVGQRVSAGDVALQHGYFLSHMAASATGAQFSIEPVETVRNAVVPRTTAPVIGLFTHENDAVRVKRELIQTSIGSGITTEAGPLGTELRVARTAAPGRVATLIAGYGGAVISVGGAPVGR